MNMNNYLRQYFEKHHLYTQLTIKNPEHLLTPSLPFNKKIFISTSHNVAVTAMATEVNMNHTAILCLTIRGDVVLPHHLLQEKDKQIQNLCCPYCLYHG